MKSFFPAAFAALLACALAPASPAAPARQVIQGTQIHLQLLNSIGTASSRPGDPFVAVVLEPVVMESRILIPAGARVNGTVGAIHSAKYIPLMRGEAYMDLNFNNIEIDSRLIPVHMSILAIEKPQNVQRGKARRDMSIVEGQVVEQKHDLKGDIAAATIGTGGGTLIGFLAGHAVSGFGIGLAGTAIYSVARRGKDVELPANTGLVVRTDNTIAVPVIMDAGSGSAVSR
jgi:hypothetical protein